MLAASSAFAHGRGRVHFGLHFGFPLYPYAYPFSYYYPAPVYHYPPSYSVRVAPSAPPVWVERDDAGREDAASWWYYCAQSRGYYPYVKSCPGGWERVPPAPPPAR